MEPLLVQARPWEIVEKLFFNKGLIRDWLLWERLGV